MTIRSHISLLLAAGTIAGAVGEARSQDAKSFDRIFGAGPNYNGSFLIPEDGEMLKHDTTTCSLSYINLEGRVRWTKDLKPYGCRLIYFNNPEEREDDRYDVVIQFENKEGYLLRSKTGRMKRLVLDQQR